MNEVREYIAPNGKSPFEKWFSGLNVQAGARIAAVLEKLARGNMSNVAGAGSIYEYKLDWGPGYRVYFGKDGNTLVILLGGGTKKKQAADITTAQAHWAAYKARKKREKQPWH